MCINCSDLLIISNSRGNSVKISTPILKKKTCWNEKECSQVLPIDTCLLLHLTEQKKKKTKKEGKEKVT
jgi:hypothetical protein